MKKGFTLLELLAVIIILSVLALISVPIVNDLIETSQKGTYIKSIEGLVDAVKIDLGNNDFKKNRKYCYNNCLDKKDDNNLYFIVNETTKEYQKIRIKGLVEGTATILVDGDGDILVAATNNKWCIKNNKADAGLVLTDYTGSCKLDGE